MPDSLTHCTRPGIKQVPNPSLCSWVLNLLHHSGNSVFHAQSNWAESTEISHIPTSPHMQGLPWDQHPPSEWHICYNWWILFNTKKKKKEVSSHEKTWRKSKCVLLSKRSQSGEFMEQWKRIQLESMRIRVRSLASLNGLRIRHCHELWCRLQMWPGSHVTVAVM